ncbi:hypothetical protein [Methylibium sp.]|uniref:hypothetical protein n=1 Tax=Methylibium sp. TaxID=2067992 RepID=UPI003D0E9DB4
MTPWHRFWFPDGDSVPPPTPDAALWTPDALAETQRELWQQATQATEDWWRYWRTSWPSLPVQPPMGLVVPPSPPASAPVRAAAPAVPPRRKAATKASAASQPAVNAPSRPRRTARGK